MQGLDGYELELGVDVRVVGPSMYIYVPANAAYRSDVSKLEHSTRTAGVFPAKTLQLPCNREATDSKFC